MSSIEPQSWWVFLVALVPALLLATLWHEAGHVVAGRIVGKEVLAWGLGVRKVFFRARLGRQYFYIGRPLTVGLTVSRQNIFDDRPTAAFVSTLGGPLASVLGLVLGLAVWRFGVRSDLLLAWIAISTLLSAVSVIPYTYRTGTIQLQSDAWLLGRILVFGSNTAPPHLGAVLANLRAMSELLDQVGCLHGAAFTHALAGVVEAALGDVDGAVEDLRLAEAIDLNHDPRSKAVATYARAIATVHENSDDAPRLLSDARHQFGDNMPARFAIDALEAHWLIKRGHDVGDRLAELHDAAEMAARRDWLCTVDSLRYAAGTEGEPDSAFHELAVRHRRFLSDAARAELLAIGTERLASRGEIDRSRSMFELARTAITEAAAAIVSPRTRAAFVRGTSAPLQRAVVATQNELPLFIPDRSNATTTTGAAVARGEFCAKATTFAGTVAGGAAVAYSMLRPESQDAAETICGSIVGAFFLLALVAALVSILRRERRILRVTSGLFLASMGILLFVLATRVRHDALQRAFPTMEEITSPDGSI